MYGYRNGGSDRGYDFDDDSGGHSYGYNVNFKKKQTMGRKNNIMKYDGDQK